MQIAKEELQKKILVIPCDYAGHTNVFDLSTPDQARKILNAMVDEFIESGYLENDPELRKAIEILDYNTIAFFLNETGLSNSRDGFIVDLHTEWQKNQF